MVNGSACTIELKLHLRGLLSTQEARVTLGYRLVRLLRFFQAYQAPACNYNSIVRFIHAELCTVCCENMIPSHVKITCYLHM